MLMIRVFVTVIVLSGFFSVFAEGEQKVAVPPESETKPKSAKIQDQTAVETDYRSAFERSGEKLKKFLEEKIPGKSIGIIPFETTNKEQGVMLSDIYAKYLTGGSLKIVDRKELEKVIKEIQLQLEVGVEQQEIKDLGSMAGADYLQMGNVTQFEDSYFVNIKVINVATGESIYADSLSFKSKEFTSVKNLKDFFPEQKYPVSALFRSALVPGWGQFYNDKPVKGGIFLGLHIALVATTVTFACLPWEDKSKSRDPKEMQEALDKGKFNKYFFVGSVSALGVNMIVSMIDAYVDAKKGKKEKK